MNVLIPTKSKLAVRPMNTVQQGTAVISGSASSI